MNINIEQETTGELILDNGDVIELSRTEVEKIVELINEIREESEL